jgi:hypothetical protein
MPVTGPELQFFELSDFPTSLFSTAGGTITETQITDLSSGMLITGVQGLSSGTVDTNNVVFYPCAALVNTDSSASATNVSIAILNGIPQTISAAGTAAFLPSSTADAGKIVRTWGMVSGAPSVIVYEDVVLGSLVSTTGTYSWARIERQEVRTSASGNPLTTLVRNLGCSVGSQAWQISALGTYATREILAYPALSEGAVSTYTVDADPTSGATFVCPTIASPLYGLNNSGNTMTYGQSYVFYFKFNLQPGMPSIPAGSPLWPELFIMANA